MRIPLPVPAPGRHGPRTAGRRLLAVTAAAALAAGTAVALGAAPASAAGGFSAGDVVVYRVGDGSTTLSGSGAPVFLDEYSPGGALLESVPLPTADAGSQHALVASGSASSEGGLTLSADGRYLVATGYDTSVGASGLSSSAAATLPRTIARVDGSGAVDSSTALTDFSDGNNPRSAVSADGSEFWVGGAAGGVRYATLGATTSTSLVSSTYKNVRQLEIVDGQLYASADPTKASVTVAAIGTGLPTTGSQTVTNLPFASTPVEPYSYSLLTLGSGTTPDTLYVADNSTGAVVKYGLTGGKWVQQGSVLVSGVTGLTANDSNGVATIYATSSGASGTTGTLYKITDPSGIGGQLSGGAAVLAQVPANQTFRGVAFAPGTVIGSGGGTAPSNTLPTISAASTGLPAALGDPTNPTLAVTVGDPDFPAGQLSVTAASSDQSVAPASGITLSGTGSALTLAVTPAAVGYATITLTATAPDGTSASTQVQYGVSANLGDPSQRYHSGAGNGSSAIDVGDGYMIIGDDETDTLRLYSETQSGPPVASFDFTGDLPYGTTSVDIEASARAGDIIYWTGSLTNSSSGGLEPARSTLFAAKITGTGANTQLTYLGSYSGLKDDLVTWDENNGSGLGANHFGFAASTQVGVGSHDADALDIEGMEFAPGDSAAYLAFRAPLEPTSDRDLALVIPLTDIAQLVTGAAPTATFGAPILMDLGGHGIREIRKNADGQYLIIAGTPDGSNSSFALYSWDGNPSDPPLASGTALPLEPAGDNEGSWETIVGVPDPLVAGSGVQLLQDNGDTAWYGDTLTSKTGLNQDLQKDLSQVFTFVPGTALATTTAVSAQPTASVTGQEVTYTADVSGPAGSLGTPTGTVEFVDGTSDLADCSAVALDSAGKATCTTTYAAAGSQTVSADYNGDGSFAGSASASLVVAVTAASTTTTVTSSANPSQFGSAVTVRAQIAPVAPGAGTPTGTVTFTVGSGKQSHVLTCAGSTSVQLVSGSATCVIPAADLAQPGAGYLISVAYSGSAGYSASTGTLTQQVALVPTTIALNTLPSTLTEGQLALITVGVNNKLGLLSPLSGQVTVSVVGANGKAVPCIGLFLPGWGGTCAVLPGALTAAQGPYLVTATFAGNQYFAPSSSIATITVTAARHR